MVVREKDLQSARADLDMVQADQLEGLQKELANAERESATAGRPAPAAARRQPGRNRSTPRARKSSGWRPRNASSRNSSLLIDVPSPIDGIVATPQRLVAELKGQFVHKGELIARLYSK